MQIYSKIWLIAVIKAEFSASFLQSSVTFWFATQETFMFIDNVENCCAASYICGKCDTIQCWVRLNKYKLILFFNNVALNQILYNTKKGLWLNWFKWQ